MWLACCAKVKIRLLLHLLPLSQFLKEKKKTFGRCLSKLTLKSILFCVVSQCFSSARKENWYKSHLFQMKFNLNPLSPNIHIQILQTDRHTFPSMNELREFDKRSRHFPLGDHFINSHNLISRYCMDIIRRKLTLVTIGT